MSEENKKKDKSLWTDEDWDEVSPIHKAHRKISGGVPLNTTVVKFYIVIFILGFLGAMFLK